MMNPQESEQKYQEAQALYSQQDYAGALALLETIAGDLSADSEFLSLKANTLIQLGREEEGRGLLEGLASGASAEGGGSSSDFSEPVELVSTSDADINLGKEKPPTPSPPPPGSSDSELVSTDEIDINGPIGDVDSELDSTFGDLHRPSEEEEEVETVSVDDIEIDDSGIDEIEIEILSDAEPPDLTDVHIIDEDPDGIDEDAGAPVDEVRANVFDLDEITPVPMSDSNSEDDEEVGPEESPAEDSVLDEAGTPDEAPSELEEPVAAELDHGAAPAFAPLDEAESRDTPQGGPPEDALAPLPEEGGAAVVGDTAAMADSTPPGPPKASDIPLGGGRRTPPSRQTLYSVVGAVTVVLLGGLAVYWFMLRGPSNDYSSPDLAPAPPGPAVSGLKPSILATEEENLIQDFIAGVKSGDGVRIKEIVASGLDLDTRTGDGETFLTLVVKTGWGGVNDADADTSEDTYAGMVAALVEGGANPNRVNYDDETPLECAAARAPIGLMGLLMDKGAEVTDSVFDTIAQACRLDVASMILEREDEVASLQRLLSAVSAQCEPVAELLLDAGADVNQTDPEGRTPLTVALFGMDQKPTSQGGGQGRKTFIVERKGLSMAELLIKRGAAVNGALTVAVASGSKDHAGFLIDQGADVAENEELIFAGIKSGVKSMVEFLVDRGVNLNVRDASGRTPHAYAQIEVQQNGLDPEIVLFLRNLRSIERVEMAAVKDAEPDQNTLQFPDASAIGTIYERARGSSGPWIRLADARGAVVVPRDRALRIDLQPGDGAFLMELAKLTQHRVEQLRLVGPAVTDGAMKYISALRSLRRLELHGTRISDEAFVSLKALKDLVYLAVTSDAEGGKVGIRGDGLFYLRELSNLRELDLTYTNVSNQGMSFLGQLRQLRKLNLSGTRVSDSGLALLEPLVELETLILGESAAFKLDITGYGLLPLQNMKNLKELAAYGAPFTEGSFQILMKFVQMERLNLEACAVTDEQVEKLTGLEALRSLNLKGTGVSAEVVDKLRAALPDCEIDV